MTDDEDGEDEVLTMGDRLRLAREAKGLSLDDIASQTRIPIRHLQNIENEDWEALPAPTYAVGFARNYANAVGLDGAALAVELRERLGGVVRTRAPAPEYYEPADPSRVPPRSLVLGALVFAALLMGAYFIWFSSFGGDGVPELVVPAEAPRAAPRPAGPQPLQPQAAAGQPVTLTATGEVWLRITDGPGGAELFSGSLNAGQSVAVPATARQPVIRTSRPQNLRASAGGRDLGPLAPEERVIANVSLLAQDLAARAQGAPPAAPAPAAEPPAADAPLSEPPPPAQ